MPQSRVCLEWHMAMSQLKSKREKTCFSWSWSEVRVNHLGLMAPKKKKNVNLFSVLIGEDIGGVTFLAQGEPEKF